MQKLSPDQNFILKFEESVKSCWNNPAVDDYQKSSITYGELATVIEKNNLLWKAAGIVAGEKIAINARSCANWATTFFSTQVASIVSVQIFPAFTPADIEKLSEHSESRLLYTEKGIFENLNFENMPNLLGAIDIMSGELLASRNGFDAIFASVDELFAKAHPDGLKPEDICYRGTSLDTLSSIMYTSGSTGNPKGVMLTNRNISANVYSVPRHLPFNRGENIVSVLPFAHIFGMTVDMVISLSLGLHLVVLGLPPIPAFLKPALRQYKPQLFFAVPLILSKLIEDTLGEFIHSKSVAAKLEACDENPDFCEALYEIFMKALGGNIQVFATGGAAIPEQFEALFVKKLKLPFITGYGMSETAPVISIGDMKNYKLRECGRYLDEVIDVKIDSDDPENIPGEIMIKGEIVFSGYYKNEDATRQVLSEDGWFRTGDLATMDKDNSLFIVGRSKNMLLSSNGQNIYPEEIEVVLNALPGVAESLIVSRNERLVALIVPDMDRLENMDAQGLDNIMKATINVLNKQIPTYCHIAGYEICYEPFAKTPKGSIRRFMYK